jgi:hypothetical protein
MNGALVLHRVGIYGHSEKEQDTPIVLDGAAHAWEHARLGRLHVWQSPGARWPSSCRMVSSLSCWRMRGCTRISGLSIVASQLL